MKYLGRILYKGEIITVYAGRRIVLNGVETHTEEEYYRTAPGVEKCVLIEDPFLIIKIKMGLEKDKNTAETYTEELLKALG